MEVYKKVRAYIEGSGCGQFAVAQKAGIPQVDFDAMMNGEKTMYADDLRAICLALNYLLKWIKSSARGEEYEEY